jgi:hypothetical protein
MVSVRVWTSFRRADTEQPPTPTSSHCLNPPLSQSPTRAPKPSHPHTHTCDDAVRPQYTQVARVTLIVTLHQPPAVLLCPAPHPTSHIPSTPLRPCNPLDTPKDTACPLPPACQLGYVPTGSTLALSFSTHLRQCRRPPGTQWVNCFCQTAPAACCPAVPHTSIGYHKFPTLPHPRHTPNTPATMPYAPW